MLYSEILTKIDAAIAKRDPRLWKQLRPGLSAKALNRRFKKIPGDTAPLLELYGWHDGTEPLRWSEGDTHKMSLLELSLVPGELCIFEDSEMAASNFEGWRELARYHTRVEEAVGRYFPVLADASDTWLCIDLEDGQKHRIVHFELQNDRPFTEAYASFAAFLADVLRANETCEPLRFFEQGLR